MSVYPRIPHFCSILHFVALPKYYAEGEFLSPRKTDSAFSLSPHLIDGSSGQSSRLQGVRPLPLGGVFADFPELLLREAFRDIWDSMPLYATCFVSLESLRCFLPLF